MKIYFACSITGGRNDESVYQAIVSTLLDGGHEVPTAHLSSHEVMKLEEVVDPREVYKRDVGWINECDALIAEVSTPSHGVGYEIAYALGLSKPVLVCYRRGARVSKMITGNPHPNLLVKPYADEEEIVRIIGEFIGEIESKCHNSL